MKKILLIGFMLILFMFSSCNPQTTGEVIQETNTHNQIDNTPSCPRGIEHDPYPGVCPLYIDKNSNGECDYGE